MNWDELVGQIVEIDWWDIEQHDECGCRLEDMPLCECASYGKLVYTSDEKVILETERRGDEQTRQVFPRGCVEHILLLEVA